MKSKRLMGKKRWLLGALVLMLIVGLTVGVVAPALVEAQTGTALRITGGNLYVLSGFPEWAYSGGKLLWSFGQKLDAAYERNRNGYTQHADNYGNLWGECVSSVKSLSKNNLETSKWMKGRRVVSGGVSSGTVIATFFGNGGGYSGHAAIFKAYLRDSRGNIVGFEVWDQNWYKVNNAGVFGKHNVNRSGNGVANADNYYVVLIP